MTAVIRREDYRPPDWRVERVELAFDIRETTRVSAELHLHRQGAAGVPLVLDGRGMQLESIAIDGRPLGTAEYELTPTQLRLQPGTERLVLRTVARFDPERNDSMEGLYRSGPMLCTQCEAHGFSRITWYPDRPDVLARFRVRIEADPSRCPVLLSNGNCVERGEAGGGRHYAVWEDPFPKPCYLFALVAGDLARVADSFTTRSGRRVSLEFYVDRGNEARVPHALASLKRAMRWDEEAYGLEYDLDTYMIVAARDFNMGAMENKGLNLFNAAYVLASPDTATDADYDAILSVIGHEYFHNWTGNRVTCRDWFQLSLKEGLTVFRDQQFSASQLSAGVERIRQARTLRARQFPEDAGPLAHPVRPDEYVEVNNFYTATVYEKGAELIRMVETLVGAATFTRGVREYLRRHDGTAATIEDFLRAHEEASGRSLDGFRRWYSQAGTPEVGVEDRFEGGVYTLRLRQRTPATPGQADKRPVPIPIRFGLRDDAGREVTARGDSSALVRADLILLDADVAEIHFHGLAARPTPCLLRGFSAPVKLAYAYTDLQLTMLAQHEDDAFLRWEAMQQLMLRSIGQALGAPGASREALLVAASRLAALGPDDKALLAELLRMPSESYLAEQFPDAEAAALGEAHDRLRLDLARAMTGPLSVWAQWQPEGDHAADPGRRALRNLGLWYLAAAGTPAVLELARAAVSDSRNMTLRVGALAALKDQAVTQREQAFAAFLAQVRHDSLMLDKWFSLQAMSALPGGPARIEALLAHDAFDGRNPNRVRAVLGAFSRENPRSFHAEDGSGYRLLASQVVKIDATNPQLAARLVDPLLGWRRLPEPRAARLRGIVEELARARLSADLREKVAKSLA